MAPSLTELLVSMCGVCFGWGAGGRLVVAELHFWPGSQMMLTLLVHILRILKMCWDHIENPEF